MRGLVVVIVCGCQQAKPEPPAPVPAVVRDAAAVVLMDGPRMFHDLALGDGADRIPFTSTSAARTASAPRVWSLAADERDPDQPNRILFDGRIVALTRVIGRHTADDQMWLVELGDAAHVAGSKDDRAVRSFAIECPASVGIDLRVGQRVHGEVAWTDHPWHRDDTARIEDDDGIVVAFDPAEPAFRTGKKTTGFAIQGYEEAHQVEANFGGTVWTPLAGWSLQRLRAGDYQVYGFAVELAPGRDVTDYTGSTTFAMFRVPAR